MGMKPKKVGTPDEEPAKNERDFTDVFSILMGHTVDSFGKSPSHVK